MRAPSRSSARVDRAEEPLGAAREVAQQGELMRRDAHVLRACDIVDEAHRELEARRVGHQRAEALGGLALARPLGGRVRRGDPAAGEARGVVGQGVDRGDGVGVGRGVGGVQGRGGAGS